MPEPRSSVAAARRAWSASTGGGVPDERALEAVVGAVLADAAQRVREHGARHAETMEWVRGCALPILGGALESALGDDYDRGYSEATDAAAKTIVTGCCPLHKPRRCCDPEDCGPCCEACPSCPKLREQRADAARNGRTAAAG